MNEMEEKEIQILYKNYRGKTSVRRIVPKEMVFTKTPWHPEKQWCLLAFDIDKEQERYFAFCDIQSIWSTQLAAK